MVAAWAVLFVACNSPSGHHTLTYFFDGVPPPAGTEPAKADPGAALKAAPKRGVHAFTHGPYAARLCEGCHETARSNALVAAPDQLCGKCHVLDLGKKYVHGPLNAGGCLTCHDPHQSQYRFLLVSDSATFCLRCHQRASLRRVDGHEEDGRTCTECHEAHMSDRPYLLR